MGLETVRKDLGRRGGQETKRPTGLEGTLAPADKNLIGIVGMQHVVHAFEDMLVLFILVIEMHEVN